MVDVVVLVGVVDKVVVLVVEVDNVVVFVLFIVVVFIIIIFIVVYNKNFIIHIIFVGFFGFQGVTLVG